MAKYSGKDFLVGLGNEDGPPETFATIAGMRSTAMTLNNEQVDVTEKGSVPWRQLLEGCGVRSLDLTLSGIFTDDQTLTDMQANAVGDLVKNYELISGRGDKFTGPFQIASLERSGEYNGAEEYSLNLVSAGDIVYTAAP